MVLKQSIQQVDTYSMISNSHDGQRLEGWSECSSDNNIFSLRPAWKREAALIRPTYFYDNFHSSVSSVLNTKEYINNDESVVICFHRNVL